MGQIYAVDIADFFSSKLSRVCDTEPEDVGDQESALNQATDSIFSKEELLEYKIFLPFAFTRRLAAVGAGQRFVHYTSADTALKIIQGNELWMRNAICMNDFMEIEHGFECLNYYSYKTHRDEFLATFQTLYPGFAERLEELFNGWLPHLRYDTYIACISEHADDEDRTGRLSMWRAYGGQSGVAMVMRGDAFHSRSDALRAYSSPVAYLSPMKFGEHFQAFLQGIEQNIEFVRSLGEDLVFNRVFEFFRWTTLCTKHEGFKEEREWRIIYSPRYASSEHVKRDVVSVGGAPQQICRIRLKDIPSEGLVGIEVPQLIDRLIVGPTQHPLVIRDAFVEVLRQAGMEMPERRVLVSDIPLRQ